MPASAQDPLVSVVIPARDAAATLARTLASLDAQDLDGRFEVIVVDDGSKDATAAIAEAAPVARLVTQRAQGPAAARNRGVAAARGQRIAFTDADCFPAPGWLAAGCRALEAAELVQGRVVPDPGVEPHPFDHTVAVGRLSGLWETANLFVTRQAFEAAGGFEEWLRPVVGKAMAEDVWFGWRVSRLGLHAAFAEDALVHHAVLRRSAAEYVGERRRLRHFPEMARKMPELRSRLFFARIFLSRRSAAADAAALGMIAAAALGSPWPLLAATPYARMVARGRGRREAAAEVLADLVGMGALARGSAEARSPLL